MTKQLSKTYYTIMTFRTFLSENFCVVLVSAFILMTCLFLMIYGGTQCIFVGECPILCRNTWVPVFTGHSSLFSLKKYCLCICWVIWCPEANKNIHCNPSIVYVIHESIRLAENMILSCWIIKTGNFGLIFAQFERVLVIISLLIRIKVLLIWERLLFWYVINKVVFHWLEWIQTIHLS